MSLFSLNHFLKVAYPGLVLTATILIAASAGHAGNAARIGPISYFKQSEMNRAPAQATVQVACSVQESFHLTDRRAPKCPGEDDSRVTLWGERSTDRAIMTESSRSGIYQSQLN